MPRFPVILVILQNNQLFWMRWEQQTSSTRFYVSDRIEWIRLKLSKKSRKHDGDSAQRQPVHLPPALGSPLLWQGLFCFNLILYLYFPCLDPDAHQQTDKLPAADGAQYLWPEQAGHPHWRHPGPRDWREGEVNRSSVSASQLLTPLCQVKVHGFLLSAASPFLREVLSSTFSPSLEYTILLPGEK